MRRIGVVVGVLVLSSTSTGCWLQPAFDAGQSRWNDGERTLTNANVSGLTELWDTAIPTAQFVREPVSAGGVVYAATVTGEVVATDAATGALRWSRNFELPQGGPSFNAPTLHGGELLVPAGFTGDAGLPVGDLLRLDSADGATIAGDVFDGRAHLTVAVADGVPAVATFRADIGGIARIDWKYRVSNISSIGGGPSPSFAIAGEHILWTVGPSAVGYGPECEPWPPEFPEPDPGCRFSWVTNLEGSIFSPLRSPAAIGTDRVVYVGGGGAVDVLDVATGAVVWSARVGAGVTRPPVVAGDTVLIATADGRLVALPAAGCGAATCTPLWEAPIGGTPASPPAAGGDVAYVGTTTGEVVAFATGGCGAATCAPLARVDAGSQITGGPIVHDGRVIVGTTDGRLVAFGLPGSG